MNGLHGVVDQAKSVVVRGRELGLRALAGAGFTQSEDRIAADAQRYWRRTDGQRWAGNSHWRAASVFDDGDLWSRIGRDHLALYERAARLTGLDRDLDRVVEWGCGGGANAVRFAPLAREFVGVDLSDETLGECERQVAAVCDTPFRRVRIDVPDPEAALTRTGGQCDLFLCFYVFELIPTPEYGERLLRIAARLLAPGGLALIQIKYDDGRWTTRSRRRSYTTALADMTTYPIDGFWQLAQRCGLTPEMVHLVPRNELDRRYAYFALTKPA